MKSNAVNKSVQVLLPDHVATLLRQSHHGELEEVTGSMCSLLSLSCDHVDICHYKESVFRLGLRFFFAVSQSSWHGDDP